MTSLHTSTFHLKKCLTCCSLISKHVRVNELLTCISIVFTSSGENKYYYQNLLVRHIEISIMIIASSFFILIFNVFLQDSGLRNFLFNMKYIMKFYRQLDVSIKIIIMRHRLVDCQNKHKYSTSMFGDLHEGFHEPLSWRPPNVGKGLLV